MKVRVGCAGWSVPGALAGQFPAVGTHLERYAAVFNAVEINSSFYRPHRESTYARWSAAVPSTFRFAVKLPRAITHERELRDAEAALAQFIGPVHGLGERLGPLLVQLPPSLAFDRGVSERFFRALRQVHPEGPLACEPRHPSWFSDEADGLLKAYRVARVAADPAVVPSAAEPAGWPGLVYYRWHGSPRMYYSAYSAETLGALGHRLAAAPEQADRWAIFDNTAGFAAIPNALELAERLEG